MNYKEEAVNIYNKVMLDKDVLLLEYDNSINLKKLRHELYLYNNILPIILSDNSKDYLVVKYTEKPNKDEDLRIMFNNANKAYFEGNYSLAIELFRRLVVVEKYGYKVFSKLGLCYYKTYSKKRAIKYLTIANILSKKSNANYNFDELLMLLKEEKGFDKKDFKARAFVREEEFKDNRKVDDSFNELYNYILESKESFISACNKLNYSDEKISLMCLIFAKNYYIHNEISMGDAFIKLYLNRNIKTDSTRSLYKDILINKKLYLSKSNEFSDSLTLSLKLK